MAKTKSSPSSSTPGRSHRFKKNHQTDDLVDVESLESSDHSMFEDESSDSQEDILVFQKRAGKCPMESIPKQSSQKRGKTETIEFGPEDKMNFYGPKEKARFVAFNRKSTAMVALQALQGKSQVGLALGRLCKAKARLGLALGRLCKAKARLELALDRLSKAKSRLGLALSRLCKAKARLRLALGWLCKEKARPGLALSWQP
ncbi:hypothetical protein A4A49_15362 [Nicotiana attenuata]|uniref:Uncharacterized protein n=1 Tax=Nicotiana attenuata TaxID=49451 RepID=A0A314KJ75_NICAT|nr:hypothetical protein A4A49_15362 [Nicotiana attenuata]